jgi:hypothetical protein
MLFCCELGSPKRGLYRMANDMKKRLFQGTWSASDGLFTTWPGIQGC